MNEAFISYLWKYRHFNQDIQTESGESLLIIHPGDQNTDSGPDFFNARVRIGSTTWAGNVEIHVLASDWYKHGHHADRAYDHAILHVVYEADRQVFDRNGEPVQTFVIRNQFPAGMYDRYQRMMLNQQWIPCENQLLAPDVKDFHMWAPVLAVERLEYKTAGIAQLLSNCAYDWEEALYQHLAASFGFKINGLAFELLAKSLPVKIVRQHCGSLFQVEALLFGQAGLLDMEFLDSYPGDLLREYHYLRGKYDLKPVPAGIWKFLRLRPHNFPTIRISQFAGFICKTQARFFNLFKEGSLNGIADMLKISASDYWNTHYVFDKQGAFLEKAMGVSCTRLLLVNGLAPFLFFYGREKGQSYTCEGVLDFLEQTGGENNNCIDRWKAAGFPAVNAIQTQALIHLKRFYCEKKRCLECRIGNRLLTS
ncbi:MAG: DUF2851 family protein [Bacteroidetes bacterium]|nr:DUF2851 family protein [Bacteroidota bacterium]